MISKSEREKQLKERLDFLTQRLERIETHMEKPPEQDWEDRAQEAEMDEVLDGLGTSGTQEIEAIRAALARIEGGSYGICVRCGEDISEERLDAVPHTPLCRVCAGNAAKAKPGAV